MNRGQKIDKMYFELINEYGKAQSDKSFVKTTFNDLLDSGHYKIYGYSMLYWALWNLGNRDIKQNKSLLFWNYYQDEVESIMIDKEELCGISNFVLNQIRLVDMILALKETKTQLSQKINSKYIGVFENYRKELNKATRKAGFSEKTDFTAVNDIEKDFNAILEKELTTQEKEQIEDEYIEYLRDLITGSKTDCIKDWITLQNK